MEWKVKRGNTAIMDLLIQDRDGATVSTLAAAASITFEVKEEKTDIVPKISKTAGDGISVNTPSEGYLRITLTPVDTDLLSKWYYMACEIVWSATEKYEIDIYVDNVETELFQIADDIIKT